MASSGLRREMAELEAAARMGVCEVELAGKGTRLWDCGCVEGSFQSTFNYPHRGSSLPEQAVPAVCWRGDT